MLVNRLSLKVQIEFLAFTLWIKTGTLQVYLLRKNDYLHCHIYPFIMLVFIPEYNWRMADLGAAYKGTAALNF